MNELTTKIYFLAREGKSSYHAANELNVSQSTIQRIAKKNNIKFKAKPGPSSKRVKHCDSCGTVLKNPRVKVPRCKSCRKHHNTKQIGKTKIEKYTSNYARHKYQAIRNHAHRIMEELEVEKKCAICNYTIYVELCHIKPISSFSKDSLLDEVNDVSNLIYLCPNHHKELDLGLKNGLSRIRT